MIELVLWLIGISGAGKTTIGRKLEAYFQKCNRKCYLLDGDEVRTLFDGDLGYSNADREANIKRIILGAYLLDKNDIVGIICNISPFERLRKLARSKIAGYNEIYLKRDIRRTIENDVKGVYRKNMGNTDIVGLDTVFDLPKAPDLVLDTDRLSEDKTFQCIVEFVEAKYGISSRNQ